MSKARCKYCNGVLVKHGGEWVMPKYQGGEGLLDTESWNCYKRTEEDNGYRYLLPHEPLTKEEKVLEILRNYRESKM